MKIYCDGSNFVGRGSGAGFLVIHDGGGKERFMLELPQDATNNEAEYLAVIHALRYISQGSGTGVVEVLSDSEVVVKQVNGEYKVREDRLKPLHSEALTLMAGITATLRHVRREQNPEADQLARLGSLFSMARED